MSQEHAAAPGREGCIALIVAGGSGTRFGAGMPKQYLDLAGMPVLRRTITAFLSSPQVGAVRCVIRSEDESLYAEATAGLDLLEPVPGGPTRQESVRRGLESLVGLEPSTVLIHDAARPLVTPAIIRGAVAALDRSDGAIVGLPVRDTVRRLDRDGRTETVDRTGLWRAQTPQAFRFREILDAHRRAADAALTDDAAVAERAGLRLVMVPGSEENIKITDQDDLMRAERMLYDRFMTRIGMGFDVHRFGPGDQVILGGLGIPHDSALVGHSDADVALHAITDALLGAIAAGDIGSHFPPSDPRWRGADSATFLRHAVGLIAERGGAIDHLDLTVICEAPRIGPHRAAMAARIAEIAGLKVDQVSVKATTTEGLGFTGRREGIAAQAVATVRMPRSP